MLQVHHHQREMEKEREREMDRQYHANIKEEARVDQHLAAITAANEGREREREREAAKVQQLRSSLENAPSLHASALLYAPTHLHASMPQHVPHLTYPPVLTAYHANIDKFAAGPGGAGAAGARAGAAAGAVRAGAYVMPSLLPPCLLPPRR
jgi:hypothetical protein